MNKDTLFKLAASAKEFFYIVRNDPETFTEIRKLALGILVCVAVLYSGNTLLLAPKEKTLAQKITQKDELTGQSPAQLVSVFSQQIEKLAKEQKQLADEIAILNLQIDFYKEHWQAMSDSELFARTLFTLHSAAPVNMENNLTQMNQLDSRSQDGFTLHNVNLAGQGTFAELFGYLQYIENRPEITVIENLTISRLPTTGYEQQGKIQFSMVIGRAALEQGL